MRVLLVLGVAFALSLSTVALMPPARVAAAAGTYWFHGQPTDQADKANGVANATFSTTAPTGLAPVVQTTTGVANQDFAANPLTAYWHGA
jgi:septal ring-binding cell division protein DamX